ncbi:tripeptidyl-peptidase II Tpp2 [Chytridiales sp. JEL 0842]|nr:tripeptidyl-peptidase II Tpp2 [Chytridiales sp. JEL 0842]
MHDFMTPVKDYPISGVLPKEETQASSFQEKFPTYDGRGTIIAILDTGVDPGAYGLQKTTTGAPKIIDLIDCTGAGDVDTTTVVEPIVTGTTKTLKGLTGRTLTIPDSWPASRDGKYKLGWKNAADLFPVEVVEKLSKERKKKFEVEHQKILVELQERIVKSEKTKPANKEAEASLNDLKAQLDVLNEQFAKFNDPGFVFDCVVFHDGKKWLAAVDVTESGDLKSAPLMTTYKDSLEYAKFGEDSLLNFSVNIYDDGDLLSIVTMSGTHGTHVAAITSANHDDPRQNGVAPGAQIVSLKIGDTRVKGMETGTGLIRAANELVRHKVDVANISYGEFNAFSDVGRVAEMLRDEAVNKAGCIVMSSAGNSGPCLSSVSTPGGISGIITVGAYGTTLMHEAMYSLLDKVTDRPMTFSSRGPLIDGSAGVDVYAPGAAITSVPEYTTDKAAFMNGTSMACPNAVGCVSLLLSGLKQQKVPYTPYRIQKALKNSALEVGDPLKVGLIQVQNAWEHLVGVKPLRHNLDVHYAISLPESPSPKRGIYLRDLAETSRVYQGAVQVSPHFFKDDDPATNPAKLQYEAHVALVSTQHWIASPEFVLLNSSGRAFQVKVDPTQLPPGLHYGEVLGFDTEQRAAGPLFRIPVTVCKPEQVEASSTAVVDSGSYLRYSDLTFTPGTIVRKFIAVPAGANFAELIVNSKDRAGSGVFFIQMVQLKPESAQTAYQNTQRVRISGTSSGAKDDESKWSTKFSVLENTTMELVLGQYFSSVGTTKISVEVVFHGVHVKVASDNNKGGHGAFTGGDLLWLNNGNTGVARADVYSALRKESLDAGVTLDTLQKSVRPTEAVITPLKSRDVLPDGIRLHQLAMTYTIKVTDEYSNVTPALPRAKGLVYDAAFDNFELQIYDAQKSLKSHQDIYPKTVKLPEGTYTIKAQLVTKSFETLEKLKNSPIVVNFGLSKSVDLPIFKTLADSHVGKTGSVKDKLQKGESVSFWIGGVEGSSLPKSAAVGDILTGSLKIVERKMPLYNVAFVVPAELKNKDAPATPFSPMSSWAAPDAVETPKEDNVQMKEAIRDLEISWLKKMKKDEDQKALLERLEKEYSAFLPFLVAKLEVLAGKLEKAEKESKEVTEETLKAVDVAADSILSFVDTKELLCYLALKVDVAAGGEEAKNKKKEMDAQKAAVILAYLWKSKVLKARVLASKDAQEALVKEFDSMLSTLSQWLPSPPTSDSKYLVLWTWRLRRQGLNGQALKAINKFLADPKSLASVGSGEEGEKALALWKDLVKEKGGILEELGWGVWRRYEERWGLVRTPPGYAPF